MEILVEVGRWEEGRSPVKMPTGNEGSGSEGERLGRWLAAEVKSINGKFFSAMRTIARHTALLVVVAW